MKGPRNCLKYFIKEFIRKYRNILHIPTLLIHQLSCSVLPIAAHELYRLPYPNLRVNQSRIRLYEKCIHGFNVKKNTLLVTVNLQ